MIPKITTAVAEPYLLSIMIKEDPIQFCRDFAKRLIDEDKNVYVGNFINSALDNKDETAAFCVVQMYGLLEAQEKADSAS